jgi:hypothetical protein
MLKNILKLEGAQKLTKDQQKSINGGVIQCECSQVFIDGTTCYITCKKAKELL